MPLNKTLTLVLYRYVGEMALLLPDRQTVRFSVLDFWGNREVGSQMTEHISGSSSVHCNMQTAIVGSDLSVTCRKQMLGSMCT